MPLDVIIAAAIAIVVLAFGGWATRIGPWFRSLRKPGWQPPDWAFGPVWTTIAILCVISAVHAWRIAPEAHARIAVLFGLNALFHMAWSPLFFMARRPDWALYEVPLLWLSVLALMVGLAPISTLSAVVLLPYLAWVSVAAALNLKIVRLNGPFGPGVET